jgi:DNA-directed RNA polymerase II subunit RPB2
MSNSVGWQILDAYFEETRYPRARIALEGYDHFVKAGLKSLIADLNPFTMTKPESRERLDMYVGGRDGTAFSLVHPKLGTGQAMLPNQARLHDSSYNASLVADITIAHADGQDKGERVVQGVVLGEVPIMLHSHACQLRGLDEDQLLKLGECPFDEGGYFIVDGKEKVVVANEIAVTNRAVVTYTTSDATYEWRCRVRTMRGEGDFPRTLEIVRVRGSGELKVLGRISNNLNSASTFTLPLFVLFRLLGMETDMCIMDAIRSNGGHAIHPDVLAASMRPSVLDASTVGYTYAAAMNHAMNAFKAHRPLLKAEVTRVMKNDVLQNVSAGEKGGYLAALVADMLRVVHGIDPPTDRDSSLNKRVDTGGVKFADLFRDYYTSFRREAMGLMDREYNMKRGEGVPVAELITKRNMSRILKASVITDGMRRGLKGSWGAMDEAQTGIVHDVPRYTMHGAMSYLSRIASQMTEVARSQREPHHIHGTHWGVVCPIESPDNKDIGLTKHFAVMAHVTVRGLSAESVKRALLDLGATSSACAAGVPVWLNGTPVGRAADPLTFTTEFRKLRRNGHLHRDVSVAWRPGSRRIEVACDAGRMSRPVLVMREGGASPLDGDTIGWSRLLPPQDVLAGGETYVPQDPGETLGLGAPIEYLDCAETDDTYIAMTLDTAGPLHTHCEIHPSTILSPVALLTPFSQHNPAVRNLFSCKQARACASLFATSFNSRADNSVHLLHASQRPMVSTRYATYFGVDTLAYGFNALVAIATFSGYNQEDSIIMNITSLQRGMFNSTHYHTIVFDEEGTDGVTEYICNPTERPVALREDVSYAHLDGAGLPLVGTLVEPGVVIVGKVTIVRGAGQTSSEVDSSLVADLTMHGVIDRVLTFPHPSGRGRRVKVRMREEREPVVGDKFSSRHGQKGIVGRLVRQEDMPFLADGTVPDLIINPHALPSRMTIAHLIEAIGAKAVCWDGVFTDATPMTGEDTFQKFGSRLEGARSHRVGDEIMYDPASGRLLPRPINFCPTYYLRLKQMVADKVAATRVGRRTNITGQPAQGRALGGGLRIGEMERDSIVANGMMSFLKESMIERSDGMAESANFIAGEHQAVHGEFGTLPLPTDVYTPETTVYKVPQALTVLQKELASMGICMALQQERAGAQTIGDAQ